MSEDTPGKQAANHGFRIRQLERRPKPEGCPCPFPWARMGNGSASVAHNTWTRVKFTNAMSYNEVAAGYAAGEIFTLTDNGDYFTITCETDGIYLIQGAFSWQQSFAEYRVIELEQGIGDYLYSEGYSLALGSGPFSGTGGPYFSVDNISSFIFKSSSVSAPDPTIDPRGYQSSGGTVGLEGYSVRLIYLGEIGAEADWIFNTT